MGEVLKAIDITLSVVKVIYFLESTQYSRKANLPSQVLGLIWVISLGVLPVAVVTAVTQILRNFQWRGQGGGRLNSVGC